MASRRPPSRSERYTDEDEEDELATSESTLGSVTRGGTRRRWSPILPFFGVLFRGLDAPFGKPQTAPTYHPSVGYARDVYVAITMNWLVDVLGFTYMFHSYLHSIQPWWLPWALGLLLGMVFSTAFATFAISLVRKPIQDPEIKPGPLTVAVLFAVAAVAGFVSSIVYVEQLGGYDWIVYRLSIAAVLLGGMVWLFSMFGFQDGSMVYTRACVMFGVGYLVAAPLHETMFYKEIMEEYQEQQVAEVHAEEASVKDELDGARAGVFGSCMRRKSMPADDTCAEAKQNVAKADLMISAIEFVKEEERLGEDAVTNRTFLVDNAKDLGATAVVALLGSGSTGLRGLGPRYRQAVKMEPEARTGLELAREDERACLRAVSQCEVEASEDGKVAELTVRIAELQGKAERVRDGSDAPGTIDRSLALEAITKGHGSTEDAQERSTVLTSRLAAAWFLAMVMPLIVLVMKVTAGDKLEPYLRKRWAGRHTA
ncbi:MAG: hypothetical protein KTR31_07055 [Myxococcales bacterium]|nr:hypothetical protein [Myxococcales bacterium]